jgi:signal transduction histidine kinase
VYFCTLEALQNAGKHAGENATAEVHASWRPMVCSASRSATTGRGSTCRTTAYSAGHGFVNMADRLGAFGGHVEVVSAVGQGTTITGTIPLP